MKIYRYPFEMEFALNTKDFILRNNSENVATFSDDIPNTPNFFVLIMRKGLGYS
jgi:hypothetical protein